ncbi:MAG: hypothetical protein ACR2LJ_14045 [Acidimicrobiales bacterium]
MDEANHSDDGSTERMAGLGCAVLDNETLRELLQGVVLLARHSVPSAHSVSITVADGDGYRTTNSTGEEALVIDEAQYEGEAGPCLEALRSTRQVRVTVGADTGHWPLFETSARESGVTSVLSSPLRRPTGGPSARSTSTGTATAGSKTPSCRPAEVIAAHVAILVANASALSGAVRVAPGAAPRRRQPGDHRRVKLVATCRPHDAVLAAEAGPTMAAMPATMDRPLSMPSFFKSVSFIRCRVKPLG